jgi:hypothetical protein
MPPLHHAVLDHQLHAPLARVVDQWREDALGLPQVLGDALRGIPPDERSNGHAAELRRGVDAGADMGVVGFALGGIRMEVVVVVGERRELQPAAVESAAHSRDLGRVEPVRGDMAGREGAVTQLRPGRELERLVGVVRGPGGDLLEGSFRHAGGEEAELHPEGTSTHRRSRADSRTASVIRSERRPSGRPGSPSAASPVRIAS